MTLDRYLGLITKDELDRAATRTWLDTVRNHAPVGVTISHHFPDGKTAVLVHRKFKDGRHGYLIPLARDLLPEEGDAIAEAYGMAEPDSEFEIVTSAQMIGPTERAPLIIDRDRYHELCMALAKRRHADWLRDREQAGWRYGPSLSIRDRTHPLIRPWDDLPDRYRVPDLDAPQTVIDLLRDQGYAVVSKDDLDRMLSALRSVA